MTRELPKLISFDYALTVIAATMLLPEGAGRRLDKYACSTEVDLY